MLPRHGEIERIRDCITRNSRVSRHSSSYMTPSITDDDDDDHETHFSDSSGRPIKPYRLRQKEPAYLGIASDSSVSNSSPAGAGLDSRLSKTEMRMKYLLNIIKLMVPRRGIWTNGELKRRWPRWTTSFPRLLKIHPMIRVVNRCFQSHRQIHHHITSQAAKRCMTSLNYPDISPNLTTQQGVSCAT